LIGRLPLLGALLVCVSVVALAACSPQRVILPTPTPTAPASLQPTPTAAPSTVTPAPTLATTTPPTVAPTATVPASPGSTPATACPALTGGSAANQVQLTAIRVAHNVGFDRVVFEFGPSTAPGAYGMPPYRVEVASSLGGPSGQAVPIDGNALFGVRFQNASTVSPSDGTRTYTGPSSIKPGTPLVKEVKLVEDFERVLVWGIGLERLVCPQILTLTAPVRLVLDFPTPP
jgi:hypothetical protein